MYKMESCCLKCTIYTKKMNPQVSSTSNDKIRILSRCVICIFKKCRFIKKQEAKGLLSKLHIKTPWSKIPKLGNVLF